MFLFDEQRLFSDFSPCRGEILDLFVVVGLAFDDGAGAIDLFCEDEADHLVREGELGE